MSKILVAEDDKFLSEAYKTKLTKAGFEVKLVFDGEEALKEFSVYLPDAVVLDIKMPKADGFFFLQGVAQIKLLKKVPIIVASNAGDKTDIEKAMNMGATDYVVKSSLSMSGLIEKINKHLQTTS